MKDIKALDNLRTALTEAALSAPAAGREYIEINNRLRSWVLDMAGSMNSIYLAVNQHDMRLSENVIPEALAVGRDILDFSKTRNKDDLEPQFEILHETLGEAIEAEDVTLYSPVFAASRASIQAVDAALRIVPDYDIFSVVIRGLAVAEQCVLANAYLNLSKDYDGTVLPSHKQVAQAIAEARTEMIPLYQEGLASRIRANMPGDFERPAASAPAI